VRHAEELPDVNSTGLLSLCDLLARIVKSERVCEGVLRSAFEYGLLLKLLKAIKTKVDALYRARP
jgi:hypothetical protein